MATHSDPLALLRPRRPITGISAILLPFTETGATDWAGFTAHAVRTDGPVAPRAMCVAVRLLGRPDGAVDEDDEPDDEQARDGEADERAAVGHRDVSCGSGLPR